MVCTAICLLSFACSVMLPLFHFASLLVPFFASLELGLFQCTVLDLRSLLAGFQCSACVGFLCSACVIVIVVLGGGVLWLGSHTVAR